MIRLTKIFTFETAHALYGYQGKCKNIHGHSYKLFVTIKGKPIEDTGNPKNGMVLDFSDLKSIVQTHIVNPIDHAILLQKNTPNEELGKALQKENHHVIFTDFSPTCENMLYHFAKILQDNLPNNIELEYLKLHETQNSYCEWFLQDQ